MRWLLAVATASVLLGAMYWGLPKLRRPELVLELDTRRLNVHDVAFEAGVQRALAEREGMAGGYRIRTEGAGRSIRFSGRDVKNLPPWEGWIPAALEVEAERIARDLEARGLSRLSLPHAQPPRTSRYTLADHLQANPRLQALRKAPLGSPDDVLTLLLTDKPQAILLERLNVPAPSASAHSLGHGMIPRSFIPRLRERGFTGPVYVAGRDAGSPGLPLSELEGAFVVLTALKPAPPEFGHPFTYVAYRTARDFFERLDARPTESPNALADEAGKTSIFDVLRGEPRLLEIREGRLEPPK